MKKRFLYLIGIVLISGLLVSCDKDSEDEKSGDFKELLIGHWVESHTQGYYRDFSNSENNREWDKDISDGSEYLFYPDGTVTNIYDKPNRVTGTWQLSENELIIKFEENGEYVQNVSSINIVELSESTLVFDRYEKNDIYEEYDKVMLLRIP